MKVWCNDTDTAKRTEPEKSYFVNHKSHKHQYGIFLFVASESLLLLSLCTCFFLLTVLASEIIILFFLYFIRSSMS